jgi:hypothetical protein
MFGVWMCLFCVCVVLCLGRGIETSWSLVQGVLPSLKWSWTEETWAHGSCRSSEKKESNNKLWEELRISRFFKRFRSRDKHYYLYFPLIEIPTTSNPSDVISKFRTVAVQRTNCFMQNLYAYLWSTCAKNFTWQAPWFINYRHHIDNYM